MRLPRKPDCRSSSNDLRMDQNNPLPATQDEVRVGAWAEVREALELQLAPLGRLALAALASRPDESIVDVNAATWVVTARARL
jgi:hypothetical protein